MQNWFGFFITDTCIKFVLFLSISFSCSCYLHAFEFNGFNKFPTIVCLGLDLELTALNNFCSHKSYPVLRRSQDYTFTFCFLLHGGNTGIDCRWRKFPPTPDQKGFCLPFTRAISIIKTQIYYKYCRIDPIYLDQEVEELVSADPFNFHLLYTLTWKTELFFGGRSSSFIRPAKPLL